MSTPEVPMSDEPHPDAVTDDLAYLGSVLTAQRGRTVIVTAMLPSGPAYPRPHVSILHTQDADGNADLLVLKRYRDPRAPQDEKRALEWARQSDTPVPVVVAAETSGNSPIGTSFVLMTYVDGRHLDEVAADGAEVALERMVEIVTQLHVAHADVVRGPEGFRPDAYKQSAWTLLLLPDRLREHLDVAVPFMRQHRGDEPADLAEALAQRLVSWHQSDPGLFGAFTPTLLHGDLHPSNIRVGEDGRVGLIDWGESCWGDAAVELAYFYVRALWLCFPAIADKVLRKLVERRSAAVEDGTLSSRVGYYAAATVIVTLRRCAEWERPDLMERLIPLVDRMVGDSGLGRLKLGPSVGAEAGR